MLPLSLILWDSISNALPKGVIPITIHDPVLFDLFTQLVKHVQSSFAPSSKLLLLILLGVTGILCDRVHWQLESSYELTHSGL